MSTISWAVEFTEDGKPVRFHGPFMDPASARQWALANLPMGTWDIGMGEMWQAATDVKTRQEMTG